MSRVYAYRSGALTEANPWQNFILFYFISIFSPSHQVGIMEEKYQKTKMPIEVGRLVFQNTLPLVKEKLHYNFLAVLYEAKKYIYKSTIATFYI